MAVLLACSWYAVPFRKDGNEDSEDSEDSRFYKLICVYMHLHGCVRVYILGNNCLYCLQCLQCAKIAEQQGK